MPQKLRALIGDLVPARRAVAPAEVGLQEAVAWLYRAQDATGDRGVSHSYSLDRGWAPSYPETTGYIIPTLLNWYHLTGDGEARRRAVEMAEWESRIQLDDGGVMASVVADPPNKPVVFNTGQAIFGWLAAYQCTKREPLLDSARRATEWLIDKLGSDETWQSHGSMGIAKAHTYNIRVVWAVLEFARAVGSTAFEEPMRRVAGWVLKQETGNGWFANNCLTENDRPLLHTIAYTARGLLESGLLLGDDRCIDAARRTADALLGTIRRSGLMPGRFDAQWSARARWSCLTGMAQMSIVWRRLHAVSSNERYHAAAMAVNQCLRARQRPRAANPGIRGGIAGSYPINGDYGKYRILNWATKFFVDALLIELYPAFFLSERYCPG